MLWRYLLDTLTGALSGLCPAASPSDDGGMLCPAASLSDDGGSTGGKSWRSSMTCTKAAIVIDQIQVDVSLSFGSGSAREFTSFDLLRFVWSPRPNIRPRLLILCK